MARTPSPTHSGPSRVAVVGAGMVGLSTAWFLQERGVHVTVYDREGVAAGASWGNAGWLTPGLATPLPEPAVLTYGVRAVLSPSSPVYVPPSANPGLLRFLAGFARNSTAPRWLRAMRALVPVNSLSLSSFDTLIEGGVEAQTLEAKSFLAAYRTAEERRVLLEEFEQIHAAGQAMEFDVLDGDEAREIEPSLSEEIGAAIRLHGQRYIDPGHFVHALADAVRARGGAIREGTDVTDVQDAAAGVTVLTGGGESERFDAVVLATGSWLGRHARKFGVRSLVQAGGGYSFSVPVEHVPSGPVYFPGQRVACTRPAHPGSSPRVDTACGASPSDPPPDHCSPKRSSPGNARRSWRRSTRCADRRGYWAGGKGRRLRPAQRRDMHPGGGVGGASRGTGRSRPAPSVRRLALGR